MPVVFKDFEKDSNDFFDKYHQKGAKGFKLEGKAKGADRTVYVNSAFEENLFTVNFQYDVKEQGLKTKFGVNPNQLLTAKITYEGAGLGGDHKVEVTDNVKLLNIFDYSGEFVHEWKVKSLPTPTTFYSKSKFSGNGLATDLSVSSDFPGVKGLSVGSSANVDANKQTIGKYKVGAQYKNVSGNCTAQVAGNYELASGAFSAGLLATIKDFSKTFGTVQFAAQTIQGKEKSTSFGLGGGCPFGTGGNPRAKVSLNGNYGLSYYKSFPNNVTVGGGFEGSLNDLTSTCPLNTLLFSVVQE